MSCKDPHILNYEHSIVILSNGNTLVITDNNKCNSITIPQPVTCVLQVNSPGPQGPAGQGDGGSVNTGSFVTNSQTSSFATTGSNTFIGNQIITGSLVTTNGIQESTFAGINLTSNVIDPPGLPYIISSPGIYQISTAGSANPLFSSYSIIFPDPITLNGTTITILNTDTTYNVTIDNPSSLIKNMNNTDVTNINNSSFAIFKAIGGVWWKL
jgi:hypothetical protein